MPDGSRQGESPAATASQLWQDALLRLQTQVTRPNFDTWLKGTVGLRLQPQAYPAPAEESHPSGRQTLTLVVGARSDFATEWLNGKLRPTINRILPLLNAKVTDVAFEVFGGPALPARPGDDLPDDSQPTVNALQLESPPLLPQTGRAGAAKGSGNTWPRPPLNPRFTFDNFVVGSSNRLAHAAAMAVASSPGSVYNPLLIFGASGLGKTHLLHAIAHEAVRVGMRVAYASVEQFTNDYANACRDRRWDEFRWRYRGADILIIDDLQFIEGKRQTLKELSHTFDELHGSSRQVVMAADRRPGEIAGLSRLGSRLQAGLTANLQPPTPQLRVSILHAKAGTLGLHLSRDVLEFLASHPSLREGNVRDLEGCLLRVAAHARVSGLPITREVAANALHDTAPEASPPRPTPDAVVSTVCEHFHLSRQLLASKNRDSQVAFARHLAMYLLREQSRCTFSQIGRLLGNRDHSTVLYGCSKIARELNLIPETRDHIDSLLRDLHMSVA